MKFICGACKTKYTISDDKVRGKVLKVKCKKCEAVVEVREAAAGAEAVARVVASGAPGSAPGRAPLADPPRARPAGAGATLPGQAGSLPRTGGGATTLGAGAGGLASAQGAHAPPPPPDALRAAPRATTPVGRAGKPPSGSAFPAARAPADAPTSGVRVAARTSAFSGSGSNGGSAGGLAGSLAEALSSSVAPAPARLADSDPARASYVDGLAAKAAPKEWWAAIRDTPTGPMTRAQIDEQIKLGEVDADSLVWREGQDDWRPLREVHALSDLLRGKGGGALGATGRVPVHAATGAADRSIGSVATPIASRAVAPAAARISTTDAMFPRSSVVPGVTPGSGSLQIPIDDIEAPAPRSVSAALPLEDFSRSVVHADSVLPAAPRRMSPVAWVAVCGSLAFGITLALGLLQYLGPRVASQRSGPTERVRVVTVGGAPPELAPAAPRAGEDEAPTAAAAEGPAAPRPAGSGARPAGGAGTAPPPAKNTKVLSQADQALLARFQQQNGMPAGGALDPNQLHRPGGNSTGPAASALTADQVRAVVGRERGSVQSCYERAMRGRSQAEDVRVTVVATVGASGAVMSVAVRGGNDAGMTQCIQGAVRRWRFPAAAGSSQPEIPFLFTAHAAR